MLQKKSKRVLFSTHGQSDSDEPVLPAKRPRGRLPGSKNKNPRKSSKASKKSTATTPLNTVQEPSTSDQQPPSSSADHPSVAIYPLLQASILATSPGVFLPVTRDQPPVRKQKCPGRREKADPELHK